MNPRINLGCPRYCDGWVCIDKNPKDERVIKADAIEFLYKQILKREQASYIKSVNLLEHLENIGSFFSLCYDYLEKDGILEIITDNAEFIPFYLPWPHFLGFSAHTSPEYHYILNSRKAQTTSHYHVFTKLHLINLCNAHGFKIIELKRITLGARLKLIAQKI